MVNIPLGKPFLKTDVVLDSLKGVLDSKWISGGPTINKFEDAVRDYNNDDGYYVAVSNATTGLELALQLVNGKKKFKDTDEVIVPSWSWVASGWVVYNVGAKPVWCDVDKYGVPYVEDIEKRITKNTKAIIVVHQMGVPCDMDAINQLSEKYGIPIVEDSACAFGSEYKGVKIGNTRNASVYSFQARKCLTTGEGGMISVRTEDDSEWLKSMRAFGTTLAPLKRDTATYFLKEQFDKIGTNYKMNDIQAAVGLAHLSYFDEEVELRDMAGRYYNSQIQQMDDVQMGNLIPDYCTRYNWQNYHIVLDKKYDRDMIVDKLRKRGVGCKWDIQAIHLEPIVNSSDVLKQTELYHNHGLWLPFFAEITTEEQNNVITILKEVLSES
jgi:perosamine synthetase